MLYFIIFIQLIHSTLFICYIKINTLDISNINPPPGRMEILRKEPLLVFDVGHNPDAIQYLLSSLQKEYPSLRWDIVFGCMQDKNSSEMLNSLCGWEYSNIVNVITGDPFSKIEKQHYKIKCK